MIELNIAGQWAVLPEDVEVSIEQNSPLWGEGSEYSFPFTLDAEQNRHILGNCDLTDGQSVYRVLHKADAALYLSGIPFFRGIIKLDDEIEVNEGQIELSLVAGILSFYDLIADMSCRDVEITDRIVIGERWGGYKTHVFDSSGNEYEGPEGNLPSSLMAMEVNGASTVNVSDEYPKKAYCNARICYAFPEDEDSVEKATGIDIGADPITTHRKSGYVVLEAERPNSAPCFYVRYFLDLLFKQLEVDMDLSALDSMEDFNRLAFMNTRCEYDMDEEHSDIYDTTNLKGLAKGYGYTNISKSSNKQEYPYLAFKITEASSKMSNIFIRFYKYLCTANSKNFPDSNVSELIEAIESGFGIRLVFDGDNRSGRTVLLKDILRDNSTEDMSHIELHDAHKQESRIQGFELSYGDGDTDDTDYNYTDWKRIVSNESYNTIVTRVQLYNNKLYIDPKTGNAYRVKISKDAASEQEAQPALFEVAAYNKVQYGDCSDADRIETVEVRFEPAIMNDVNNASGYRTNTGETRQTTQQLAKYVEATMQYPSFVPWIKSARWVYFPNRENYLLEIAYSYLTLQRFDDSVTDQSYEAMRELRKQKGAFVTYIRPMKYETENPIFTASPSGIVLGIMRGPGSDAGIVDYDENYDGNGNSKYTTVAGDYAFTSDTIDAFGNQYDYNGSEEGGVEDDGRFSLKLHAEKPNPEGGEFDISLSYAKRRGLFDKFYREYAEFVTTRKIVKLTCSMEIADLVNLKWEKRYRFGPYVGFINRIAYSVSKDGIGEVSIDLYV